MAIINKSLLVVVLIAICCYVSATESEKRKHHEHQHHHHRLHRSISSHTNPKVSLTSSTWFNWDKGSKYLANMPVSSIDSWNIKRFEMCQDFIRETVNNKKWVEQITELVKTAAAGAAGQILPELSSGVKSVFGAAQCAFGQATRGALLEETTTGPDLLGVDAFGSVIMTLIQVASSDDYSCISCLMTAPDNVFDAVWSARKHEISLCGHVVAIIKTLKSRTKSTRGELKTVYPDNIYSKADWDPEIRKQHAAAKSRDLTRGKLATYKHFAEYSAKRRTTITGARDALLQAQLTNLKDKIVRAAKAIQVGLGSAPAPSESYNWKHELKAAIDLDRSNQNYDMINGAIDTLISGVDAKRFVTSMFTSAAKETCTNCPAPNAWKQMVALSNPFAQFAQGYWCWLDFGEAAGNTSPSQVEYGYVPDWWNYATQLRRTAYNYLTNPTGDPSRNPEEGPAPSAFGFLNDVPNMVLSLGDNILTIGDKPGGDLNNELLFTKMASEDKWRAYVAVLNNLNKLNAMWVITSEAKNYHGWAQCPTYFYHPTSVLPLIKTFKEFLDAKQSDAKFRFDVKIETTKDAVVEAFNRPTVPLKVDEISYEQFHSKGFLNQAGNIVSVAAKKSFQAATNLATAPIGRTFQGVGSVVGGANYYVNKGLDWVEGDGQGNIATHSARIVTNGVASATLNVCQLGKFIFNPTWFQ